MGLLESACESVVAVQDVVESPACESDVCPRTAPGAQRYAERHTESNSGSAKSASRNQRRALTGSRGSFLPAISALHTLPFSPCQSSMSSRGFASFDEGVGFHAHLVLVIEREAKDLCILGHHWPGCACIATARVGRTLSSAAVGVMAQQCDGWQYPLIRKERE
jgi:hypothetical protein